MTEPRIPVSLGVKTYADAWNNIATKREHAYELVDESRTEEELVASAMQLVPHFIEGLALSKQDRVLEIGCGVARLGKEIAPHVGEWWGLDVSAGMVKLARERCSELDNVQVFVGDGADLKEIPDASVDKVYCHAVFIHMDKEDWYSYLCEAFRVAKPGALFYFDVWNICDPAGWLRWQMERSLYRDKSERPIHRNQFSSPGEARTMVKMAGWTLVDLTETFSLHVVASRTPEGVSEEDHLAQLRSELGECWKTLRYREGDYRSFTAILSERLRERGDEPEITIRDVFPDDPAD